MAKSKTGSAAKRSQTEVRELRAQLKRAQKETERWKRKAAQLEKAHAAAVAEAEKRTKQRDKARRRLQQPALAAWAEPTASGPVNPAPVGVAAPPMDGAPDQAAVAELVVPDPSATSEGVAQPDESWTVARLREEARARGLTGVSGKTKAQLLDALR